MYAVQRGTIEIRHGCPNDVSMQMQFVRVVAEGFAIPEEVLQQECSRHRCRFDPPSTPDGYWCLSLGGSDE
jgi:hypothetical protein